MTQGFKLIAGAVLIAGGMFELGNVVGTIRATPDPSKQVCVVVEAAAQDGTMHMTRIECGQPLVQTSKDMSYWISK
jgi:hypothetical protein